MHRHTDSLNARKLHGLLASLVLLLSQIGCSTPEQMSSNGIETLYGEFDLRSWNIEDEPTLRLNEGWKFFPGEKVRPSEDERIEHYRTVQPSTNVTSSDVKKKSFGVVYGALRLPTVSDKSLALTLTSFGSAATIWAATGESFSLIGRTGRVGSAASEELVEPGIFVFPLPAPPAHGLIEILIE